MAFGIRFVWQWMGQTWNRHYGGIVSDIPKIYSQPACDYLDMVLKLACLNGLLVKQYLPISLELGDT